VVFGNNAPAEMPVEVRDSGPLVLGLLSTSPHAGAFGLLAPPGKAAGSVIQTLGPETVQARLRFKGGVRLPRNKYGVPQPVEVHFNLSVDDGTDRGRLPFESVTFRITLRRSILR
jgi:hypothetical protein